MSANLLLHVLSGMCGAIVLVCWLRPETFPVLVDLPSGHPSLGAQGQFTAMVTATWGFVYLSLTNAMSEWYFGGYMLAFAGAKFGSAYLKMKGGPRTREEEGRKP